MTTLLFLLLSLTSITDGDSIRVDGQRIRFYGIDAPEANQPGGAEATAFIKTILTSQVQLEVMDTDRYGRTVAIVYTADGANVNLQMVQAGHAWFYPQYCKVQPVCSQIKTAEEDARQARKGLWAEENPTPPWLWRRKK